MTRQIQEDPRALIQLCCCEPVPRGDSLRTQEAAGVIYPGIESEPAVLRVGYQKQINYSTGKTLSKSSRLVDLTGEYDLCGLLLPCSRPGPRTQEGAGGRGKKTTRHQAPSQRISINQQEIGKCRYQRPIVAVLIKSVVVFAPCAVVKSRGRGSGFFSCYISAAVKRALYRCSQDIWPRDSGRILRINCTNIPALRPIDTCSHRDRPLLKIATILRTMRLRLFIWATAATTVWKPRAAFISRLVF